MDDQAAVSDLARCATSIATTSSTVSRKRWLLTGPLMTSPKSSLACLKSLRDGLLEVAARRLEHYGEEDRRALTLELPVE